MSGVTIKATLAIALLGGDQSGAPGPLELRSGVPVEIELRTPAAGIEPEVELLVPVEAKGMVFLWAMSPETDPRLSVTLASGGAVRTDDDGGGGTTAFLTFEVESGQRVAVNVAGAPGRVRVQAVVCPERADALTAATAAQAALVESQALVGKGEHEAARECCVQAIDALLALGPPLCDGRALTALSQLGLQAMNLGVHRPSLRAREAVARELEELFPPEHSTLLSAKGHVARSLRELGAFRRALPIDEAVLAARLRTQPADHPDVLWAMHSLAWTLGECGQLELALELQEDVVRVRAATLAENHSDRLWSEHMLGRMLERCGQLGRAIELLERVERERARALPAEHPDRLWAMHHLAWTLAQAGDVARAKELQERVLAAFERTLPHDSRPVLDALHNLAWTLYLLGECERAQSMQEHVLSVREGDGFSDAEQLEACVNNLALTLIFRGDLLRARLLQERVLQSREQRAGPDEAGVLSAISNLAITIYKLGDFERALVMQLRVVEGPVRTQGPGSPQFVAARVNLASTLLDLGKLAESEQLLRAVLDDASGVLTPDHPFVSAAARTLSELLIRQRRLDEAQSLIEAVLDRDPQRLPSNDPRLASELEKLGRIHSHRRDYRKAVELQSRALAMLEARYAEDFMSVLRTRGNLLYNLCRVDERERLRSEALLLARGLERALVQDSLNLSPREAEARSSVLSRLATSVLFAALHDEGEGSSGELDRAAFQVLERVRGARLSNLRSFAALARDGALSERVGTLRAEVRRATAGVAAAALGEDASSASFQAALERKEELERTLLELLRSSSVAVADSIAIDVDELRASLADGEAAVGFWYAWERGAEAEVLSLHLIACVSTRERPLELVDLGPLEPIEEAIRRWRAAVLAPVERGESAAADRAQEEAAVGAELARALIEPLRARLGATSRWYVAAFGALHLLPLDALPVPGAGDARLGDVLELVAVPALGVLAWPAEVSPGEPTLLVAGGIDFDLAPASPAADSALAQARERGGAWELGFGPLPESDAEAKTIAALFRKSFPESAVVWRLSGSEASRAALEALAPRARFLHLATHGYFAPETIATSDDPDRQEGAGYTTMAEEVRGMSPMLLCGLALSGANLPPDDLARMPGVLTAEELASLDLSGCELAVLSACDTHVGLRRGGAGIASLQTALHAAGARTSITSLWKVPDEATKDLMVDFYRRAWVVRRPLHQALWEAKRRLRERRDPDGRALYSTRDWAAWSLCATGR